MHCIAVNADTVINRPGGVPRESSPTHLGQYPISRSGSRAIQRFMKTLLIGLMVLGSGSAVASELVKCSAMITSPTTEEPVTQVLESSRNGRFTAEIGSTHFEAKINGKVVSDIIILDYASKRTVAITTLGLSGSTQSGRTRLLLENNKSAILTCINLDQTNGVLSGRYDPVGAPFCSFEISSVSFDRFILTPTGRPNFRCGEGNGETWTAENCRKGICDVTKDGINHGDKVEVINPGTIKYTTRSKGSAVYKL